MKAASCVVFITTPPGKTAKTISNKILNARLAACVNTLSTVESRYWWKGKLESANESLLIVKTTRRNIIKLVALVRKIHPYSVPEIIAVPIVAGNAPYLKWLQSETASS